MNITVDYVKELVAEIAAMTDDSEKAHGQEDDLHQVVLAAIRDGQCDDPTGCAREALMTLDLDFSRWCA